jgi:hypothetical protein
MSRDAPSVGQRRAHAALREGETPREWRVAAQRCSWCGWSASASETPTGRQPERPLRCRILEQYREQKRRILNASEAVDFATGQIDPFIGAKRKVRAWRQQCDASLEANAA